MTVLPRFYPILDADSLERRGLRLIASAEAVLEGGARLLQLRVKGHYSRRRFTESERIADLCRQARATLVIDDRADIARLLDAGLHVGQDDLPPVDARRVIGAQALLGFSTHNAAQCIAAQGEPADYLAIGPVFATGSKARPDPVVGVDALRALRALTARPLVAIGGITRANALLVMAAGADAVAVIGDLLGDGAGVAAIRERVKQWCGLLEASPE